MLILFPELLGAYD